MQDQLQKNDFSFAFAVDAVEKSSDGRDGRFIAGFVSTDHLDRQGETLIQEGLDFRPFLKKGWFNDNHDAATDALVGYPTMAELRPIEKGGHKGWYVEGELLKGDGTTRADKLWQLAKSLQKSDRRLGFSVQGSITERDTKNPKLVKKALVSEVAITRCPVNTATGLDLLAKSLSAGEGSAVAGEQTPGSAKPLKMESLEGAPPKKKKKKRMRKSVAVQFLRKLQPKLSPRLAEIVVEHSARNYPAET